MYVGGITTSFYFTSSALPDARFTKDVDCVVEVVTKKAYYRLQESLRELGFKEDVSSSTICRWLYDDILVDIMPIDPSILGFSNIWYKEGIANTMDVKISEN